MKVIVFWPLPVQLHYMIAGHTVSRDANSILKVLQEQGCDIDCFTLAIFVVVTGSTSIP